MFKKQPIIKGVKGFNIEHSDFKDKFGFVSFRLPLREPV